MKTRTLSLFAAAFALALFTAAGVAEAAPATAGAADEIVETTACGSCGCAAKKKGGDGHCKGGCGDCKGGCGDCKGGCGDCKGGCGDCKGGCGDCKGGCDKCDGGCDKCDGGCDKCDGKKAAKAPMAFDEPPAVGTKATCPVMGGEFTVTEKTQRSEYEGKHYAFCCPGCKPKFDADPGKYVGK